MKRFAGLLAAALIVLGPVEALAQQAQRPRAPAQAPPQPEAPPEPPPAPYERDLLSLAEVMGSLAFLRQLCGAPDAAEWPRRMEELLQTEGTTERRRARLAGAYNKGFRDFATTYRICTDNAVIASSRFLGRGEELSRSIAARYGG
jgi:uncharacterized protein (TIGR02301 family)